MTGEQYIGSTGAPSKFEAAHVIPHRDRDEVCLRFATRFASHWVVKAFDRFGLDVNTPSNGLLMVRFWHRLWDNYHVGVEPEVRGSGHSAPRLQSTPPVEFDH